MSSPPATIGRYEIRGVLGRGMMGVVYDAFDPTLSRVVALKTIQLGFSITEREREAFEERFFAEARAAARLQHPNVVVIHDLGRDEARGMLYMALERLAGRSLAEVAAEGPQPWRQVAGIGARLAEALHAAHGQGIVHRDIKPANVMLLPSGEPKILDFGIAKLPTSRLTAAGQVFGTPANMSPEQAQGGEIDARADLFSLGTVLYELLTGRRAFDGDDVYRILAAVAHSHPAPPSASNPELPAALDALMARLLAKDPDRRYATGRELAEDLDDVLEGRAPRHLDAAASGAIRDAAGAPARPASAPRLPPTLDLDDELNALVSEPTRPTTVPPALSPRAAARRARRRLASLALAAVAAVLVAYWAGRGSGSSEPPAPQPQRTAPEQIRLTGPAPPATPAPDPATLAVDFDHHLKSGNLRIWVDGEVALDRWLAPDSERNVLGIKLRSGRLQDEIELAPGVHDVRVRLAWDDNTRSDTSTVLLTEGETRQLAIRLNRITKRFSATWSPR